MILRPLRAAATLTCALALLIPASAAHAATPSVAITGIAAGTVLRGTVPVSVAVGDPAAIERVDVFAGTKFLGSATQAPFTVQATSWWAPAGATTLKAKVTGKNGSVRYTAPVPVTVPEQSVKLTGLDSGARLTQATATAAAFVADPASVARVDLYAGAAWLGSADGGPYGFAFSPRKLPTGNHAVKLKVTDIGGGVRYTPAIGVFTDTTAPAAALTTPSTGTVGTPVALSADATDDDAVAAVDFYAGTTWIGRDTTAPYAANWTPRAAGSTVLKAKATDRSGNLRYSAAAGITVANPASGDTGAVQDDVTAPLPLMALTGVGGDRTATLTWNASTAVDLSHYRVLRDGQLAAVVPAGTTRATITGLTNGTAATFSVAAVDHNGNVSLVVRTVSVTPTDTVAPDAPVSVAALPGDGSATVSWSPALATDVAGYRVLSAGRVVAAVDATTTTATIAGLPNDTPASFTVVTVDDDGLVSTASATVTVTPADTVAPDAPDGLTATLDFKDVVLAWKPSTAADVASYHVLHDGDHVATVTAPASTYTVTRLKNNSVHTFAVAAVDRAGNRSALSAPVTIFVHPQG